MQPNRWTCSVTALAYLLDEDVDKIIERIGHDGSERIWPELPDPKCRRSFHPQELLDVCLTFGGYLVEFEADPLIGYSDSQFASVYPKHIGLSRLLSKMQRYSGLIYGEGAETMHWWALRKRQVYDPSTDKVISIDEFIDGNTEIAAFYALL